MKVTHVLDLDTARALTANSRGRWPTQKATAQVKADIGTLLGNSCTPLDPPVEIDVTLSQRTKRRRDPDNVPGIAKPIIDAIVAAGVIPDDGHKYVDRVSYRVAVDPDVKKGTVRLDVDMWEVPA